MIRLFKLLIRDNEAASAVEYAILVALIAVVFLLGLRNIGGTLGTAIGSVDTSISSTTGSSGSGDSGGGGGGGGGDGDGDYDNDDDD